MNDPSDLSPALAAFRAGDLETSLKLANAAASGAASPAARHLLGLIHCRMGDLGAGIDHLRAAASGDPANAAFELMLARALVDAGRAEEALELAEPPRSAEPAALALWHVRAEAADRAGRPDVAVPAWQVMAAARPSDWRAWSNLGNAQAAAAKWSDAAASLQRAAQFAPSEAAVQRNLASALGQCGRSEEAIAALKAAIAVAPDDLGSRLTLARLLADLGRNNEAMESLDAASAIAAARTSDATNGAAPSRSAPFGISADDPAMVRELGLLLERTSRMDALRGLLDHAETAGIQRAGLGYLWAALALRDGDPAEARRMLLADEADRPDAADGDPVRRNRLLAKIEDALGNPEAAFKAARAMNEATHDFDRWRRRGAQYRRWVRGIGETITPAWAKRLPQLPSSKRRAPAFLVGFPRSGTTLLDTFLMGHGDTEVLEELPMLEAARQAVGDFNMLPDRSPQTVQRARDAYFDELHRNIPAGFAGLVIDKLPLNIIGMPLIHCLFPDSPVIFAQRHPCDAVLSGFMQSFVLNDAMACFLTIEDAADLYDAVMTTWFNALGALDLKAHTITYERLVEDPRSELRPLVTALGLDWSEELLDHRSTAAARGAITTPSYDQVTQPLTRAPVGRWKRYEEYLRPVLPRLLPWAERLGYAE